MDDLNRYRHLFIDRQGRLDAIAFSTFIASRARTLQHQHDTDED